MLARAPPCRPASPFGYFLQDFMHLSYSVLQVGPE
jgi:hypothetical protein